MRGALPAAKRSARAPKPLPRPDCQAMCNALDNLEAFSRKEAMEAERLMPARAKRLLTFLSGVSQPNLEDAVYFLAGRLGFAWKANTTWQGALVQIIYPDLRASRGRRNELEHVCEVFEGADFETIKRLSKAHGKIGALLRMNENGRQSLRREVQQTIRQRKNLESV